MAGRRLSPWNIYKNNPDAPIMTAEQLRVMRLEVGISQSQLADRMRLSCSYIGIMESGHRRIPHKIAQRITNIHHYHIQRETTKLAYTREEILRARDLLLQNRGKGIKQRKKIPPSLLALATSTARVQEEYLKEAAQEAAQEAAKPLPKYGKQKKPMVYRNKSLKTRVHRPYGMSITKMSDRP